MNKAAIAEKPTTENRRPASSEFYFAMALDPIHVGAGGYRLGRVDNTIVREPGTRLPKLPGTSLSGACRAYAAMALNKYEWPANEEKNKKYCCAGQGQPDEEKNKLGHCGLYDCPVCVSFGFSNESTGFQGLAQFSDVRILFFPVYSLTGPIWITCPAVLNDAGLLANSTPSSDKIMTASDITAPNNHLNLGWLMLEVDNEKFTLQNGSLEEFSEMKNIILPRSVLVPNKLFAQIVNDNLEVRTSVSINPETGAAEDGALFTYEAIPRATVFWFNISYLDTQYFKIKVESNENGKKKIEFKTPTPTYNGNSITVRDSVEKGLNLFEILGIGGMNTRGMGRLRILKLNSGGENHYE